MKGGLTPMPDIEARPAVADITLRQRAGDLWGFIRQPSPFRVPYPWGRHLLAAVGFVYLIDLLIDFGVQQLLDWIDASVSALPDAIDFETTLEEDLISFLLFAPLTEEALFRGWLTGKLASLRFAVFGAASAALFIAAGYVGEGTNSVLVLAGFAVLAFGLWQWSQTRFTDTRIPDWFAKNFTWLVWASSLAFGLVHLANYQAITGAIDLVVVLPQTIGGLLLAYTRVRFGLRAAMLHHAAFNAVYLLTVYQL